MKPLILIGVALGALLPGQATAAVEPPSPAGGHAAVVAQGVIDFSDGAFHWEATSLSVAQLPTSVDTAAPVFLVTTGPNPVVVSGPAGPIARLASGEASFRPAGEPTDIHASVDGATATALRIVPGDGGDLGFTPGAGMRDVDLVRDVLSTNEALVFQADVSAFAMVVEGSLTAGGTTIAAGAPVALTGDVTLLNTSPDRVTVLVAVIGPTIGDVADPAGQPSQPATSAPEAPTNPGSTPTVTVSPETTTPDTMAPETTPETAPESTAPATTTTPPGPTDSDGDGLLDSDEASFGTDPLDSDTDNDGLSDGADRANGCSPTSFDTDGDGFPDGSEVNAGTNCAVANNG